MKKCMIMFALLVMTLILAILTERKQELSIVDDLAMEEKLEKDISFEHPRPNQKDKAEN